MEDWNEDLLNSIEREILDDKFTLNNLNYTHYYFYDPENYEGSIISTSIRLYPNNDIWCKKVVTKYVDANTMEKEISYERDITKDVITNIENNIDLRLFNNNYSSNFPVGEDESYEIVYNSIYKIIGSYDNNTKEFDKLMDLLTVKDILEDEKKKVSDIL